MPRKRLIDSLVSNLSVLNACIDSAAGSDAETLLRHRTALKLYVFFLHWVMEQAEAEARDAGAAAPPPPAAKCDQKRCHEPLRCARVSSAARELGAKPAMPAMITEVRSRLSSVQHLEV